MSSLGPSTPVVVISGASSGIGRATAEAFAKQGWMLVLASRNPEALETVVQRCVALGGQALAVPADMGNAAEVKAVADKALEFGRRIDVWVANVGSGAVGAYHRTPIEAHEQVIKTNLISHMNEAHAAIPVFLEQGKGIFINMISLGGFAPAPFAAAYSASKFGLRGFGEALRGELARYPKIHVCDIYPSFVDTPGISHAANYTGRALSAPPPLLDPRTVAAAIVRLAKRPKPTTLLGSPTWLVRLGHVVSPEMVTRLTGRFLRTYFKRARSLPKTDGNLFHPSHGPGAIEGGLRSPQQRRTIRAGVAMLGMAGIVVVAARVVKSRR